MREATSQDVERCATKVPQSNIQVRTIGERFCEEVNRMVGSFRGISQLERLRAEIGLHFIRFEWELNDVYDISGWDIRKTFELLHKSNPTLFEWNNSPIVYKTTPEWEQIRSIITDCFMSKTGIYHYLSTAKHNYKAYFTEDEVKLKKYFYVLRPLLAARWIISHGTPPPMLFSELMDAELDEAVRPDVEKLLDMKMNTSEIGKGKRIKNLDRYISTEMADIQILTDSLAAEKPVPWEELDDILFSLLGV